jgi:hypothetical protein
MNLIVMTSRQYAVNYIRRELIRSARASGNLGLYVRCTDTIEIILCEKVVARFAKTAEPAIVYDCIRQLTGAGPSLVLMGFSNSANEFALRAREFLANSLIAYDVHDDFTYGATGTALSRKIKLDLQWRAFCDVVLVLEEGLRRRYPKSVFIGSASHLRPLSRGATVDARRMIYAGSIDDRVDMVWLEELARLEVSLDIYGWIHFSAPEMRSIMESFVKNHRNVFYRGAYEDADLSEILRSYSVGLVPYKKHFRKTTHVNPSKIYHYLNAGLEVVAASIPQAIRLKEFIHLVDRGDDFSSVLDRTCCSPRAPAWPVDLFTWDQRWQEMRLLTSEHLKARASGHVDISGVNSLGKPR